MRTINRSILLVVVVMVALIQDRIARAAGAFSSPVQNSFTLSFDSSSATAPGPVDFTSAGNTDTFDDAIGGEFALWGSFGGAPDAIIASISEDIGPNGVGDNAAKLEVQDTTPGAHFSALDFSIKGLRLGNTLGGTASGDEPIPDDANNPGSYPEIFITAPVRTNVPDGRFRITFSTGRSTAYRFSEEGETVSIPSGNYPGLIDDNVLGQRVLALGPGTAGDTIAGIEIGSLPVDTWGTQANVGGLPVALNENPSSLNGWANAPFSPVNFRSPRSFNLTRVGVTFPGGGPAGEVLLGEFTMSGDDVLKYHAADFNYDEMVDAADIDMLTEAINALAINDSLPPVPTGLDGLGDFFPEPGVNQFIGIDVTFAEKFSLTTVDNDLDVEDLNELVLNILDTDFGDVDLDGDVDTDDRNALLLNLDQPGDFGWADGDLDGDDDVDSDDLAILDSAMSLPGDANGDGTVDLLDLDILGINFGMMTANGSADGDFNGDGEVDLLDLDILGSNFGAGTSSAVPEPTTATLLVFLLVGVASHRKRSE